MAEAWGSATANKGGGGGGNDPNVLKLQDSTRVRLLDSQGPRKWVQHGLDGKVLHELFPEVDEATFRSLTCPRGPNGTLSAPCPLHMKPSYIHEGKAQQLFPISVRYAANVWDYESGSVKILIGGKQIFAEFDAVAQAGFDPTASDFLIIRMGKDRQTSYKVVRGGTDPLPKEIKPEDLHDLDKFEAPDSADRMFEVLGDVGVDYDAIPLPEFTLEEALQFVMPYTKHKSLTMEQLYAVDADFMKWLYGQKREQGQYGDAVFQAMHTVLLSEGETTPIEDMPKAPPRAAVKSPPKAPSPTIDQSRSVLLVPPGQTEPQEYPVAAESGLLAAGFTRPAPPEPPKDEPTEEGIVTMVGPDGKEVEIQRGSMGALIAVGFRQKASEPDPIAPPAEGPVILVGPDGNETDVSSLPNAAIQAMLAAGYKPPMTTPAESVSATELLGPDGSKMDITTMPREAVDAMVAAGFKYVKPEPARQPYMVREGKTMTMEGMPEAAIPVMLENGWQWSATDPNGGAA